MVKYFIYFSRVVKKKKKKSVPFNYRKLSIVICNKIKYPSYYFNVGTVILNNYFEQVMALKKFLLKNAIRLLKVVSPAAQPSMSTGLKPSPFQNKAFGDLKDAIKELSEDPNARPLTAPIDTSGLLATKCKPIEELSIGEKVDLARFMTVSRDPDVDKLFSLWESASNAGIVEATYSYADCIRAGRGTQRDPEKAFHLMQQLAKEKNLGEAHVSNKHEYIIYYPTSYFCCDIYNLSIVMLSSACLIKDAYNLCFCTWHTGVS